MLFSAAATKEKVSLGRALSKERVGMTNQDNARKSDDQSR
jgi:hypothetical protein